MRTLILYYSRTGTTATLAKAIAAKTQSATLAIKCERYRPGALRYLLAGYNSVRGRLPEIDLPIHDFREYDIVVLGSPIWTSYPSLPLRTFLSQKPPLPQRVALFLTCGGHSPPQKAIEFVSEKLPGPLETSLVVREDDIRRGDFSKDVDLFASQIDEG